MQIYNIVVIINSTDAESIFRVWYGGQETNLIYNNGNPHLIKLGISSISYDVLKRKYNEMMDLFDNLIFEVMYLCKEYSMGTFTKHLSREDIRDIAKMLNNLT